MTEQQETRPACGRKTQQAPAIKEVHIPLDNPRSRLQRRYRVHHRRQRAKYRGHHSWRRPRDCQKFVCIIRRLPMKRATSAMGLSELVSAAENAAIATVDDLFDEFLERKVLS